MMEWYAAYLVLGAITGFLAGLFGVGGGFDLAEFKRRMNSMQATIDAAIAEQDELF